MDHEKLAKLELERYEAIQKLSNLLTPEQLPLLKGILRFNHRIENEMMEVNYKTPDKFDIREFLVKNFSNNGRGYHDNVPIKLKLRGVEFISVDSHWEELGITRFQGCIIGTYGTPISPEAYIYPLIRRAEILTIYNGTHPCWTIWFKEPVTQEKFDELTAKFLEENKIINIKK
jgi:hypothetical protein